MTLTHEVLTDEQLKYMLSVGTDHPIIRGIRYAVEVRIQNNMSAIRPDMTEAELKYLLGRQDEMMNFLVWLHESTQIESK